MRFFLVTLVAVTLARAGHAGVREIALSFDDVPLGDTQILTAKNRSELLIENLKKANVPPVVFFCNTSRFDEAGRTRVERYVRAGHRIANHSHSHFDLNSTDVDAYWKDVVAADAILKPLNGFRPWFRFPYLREGKTAEKRDTIRRRLKELGYVNGYVTVDTADWYMDLVAQKKKAEGNDIDLEKLKSAYTMMIVDSVEFYDELGRKALGRSPKHVLLLHENDLAALFIADLVKSLRIKGWKIISPDEAYTDPIAREVPETFLLNQGRVAAIARTKGYTGSVWSRWEEESDIDAHFARERIFSPIGRSP